ncbi:MAG TPA: hypothetical protein VHK69_06090 [Chitinophagaceae bacterium]|jgi:hypothetical protein|nr:hypothetical protein [Chitinophagaceae bacterium]
MDNLLQDTSVTIPIPYKGAGNIIRNRDVSFHISREGAHYRAVPQLTADELRVANLPPEMRFSCPDGKVVSLWGRSDGNLHVLEALARALEITPR